MKCNEALKYIYLYQEIELKTKIKTELEEHLRTCTKCQNEFAAAGKYFNMIISLQKKELQIENPESITTNIIDVIKDSLEKVSSKPKTARWDIIYLPSFRYAAAIFLLLMGMFYFSEEFTAFQKISKLENRYSFTSEKRFKEIKYMSLDPTLLNPLVNIYSIVKGETKYVELPGDWVIIKESEILKRIVDYKISSDKNIASVDYEKELKRFFSNPQIQKLMNKNNEIKNLFNRVFPEGVDNHE